LTKYIPEYFVQQDYLAANKIVNTVLICLVVIAVFVIFLVSLFLNKIIILFFPDNPHISGIIKTVFFIMMLAFICNLMISLLYSIFSGLQRYDLRNYLNICVSTFTSVGTFIVLINGGGLISMAIVNLAILFLCIIPFLIFLKHVFPQLNWSPRFFDFSTLKNIYSYSMKIFVTTLSGIANFHLPKFILGYFLGSGYVTYYHIGQTLAYYTREIPGLLTQPIMSVTSELNAKDKSNEVEKLYFWTNRYINITGLFLASGMFIFAKEFITLWLGSEHDIVVFTIKVLAIVYFTANFTYSPVNILFGIGKPEYPMYTSILSIGLLALLGVILTTKYGYTGTISGISLSILISSILLNIMFCRTTKFSFLRMLKSTLLKPVLAISISSGAYLLFINLISTPANFLYFFIKVSIFVCINMIIFLVSGENLRFRQYTEVS